MNRWRWSDAHKAVFSHTPFGFLPGLKQVFGLAAPIGGGNATIQRAAYRYGGALPYAAVHGAGYRGIYDMGSTDTSLYMISTGQSGNIFSPFYGNLTAAWARGEYLTMTTDEKAISRKALATLQLQPAGEISR
jgi:penicillin amidase